MLALVLAATAGCDNQFTRLGMPTPITEQGKRVLSLWQGSWIAAFAVGALVWGLIIWAVIFHRKRSNDLPPQVRYNMPIEALYTVVPFIIVAVLFYFTARDETYLDETTKNPNVTVNVTAFQWSWKFDYPQSGVSVVGRPGADPTLVIPAGRTVRFNLKSTDVIHSFWVPAFLFKRDVVPGHPNHFEVTTTKTGTYAGRCAELCGVDHSRMLFNVEVVSPSQYQDFITKNKPAGSAQ
ncbi:MAG TPA: cytochrome c oxidase subunit II [Streptosporangiaceae bacterium]